MMQLQNFSRLILVFLTAPLGIIGASLALNLANKPFGFVALLGLIALAGMIMRNAVILVDQIEHDVEQGTPRARRSWRRPSGGRAGRADRACGILAMIPLSGSAFWGPMAYTIMGGLFVATFLTILFLPALYASGSGGASTSAGRVRPRLTRRTGWRSRALPSRYRSRIRRDERRTRPADRTRAAGSLRRPSACFRTIGYHKTTVADIAKELRMSPANVYRFFDSKRAINEAVAERCTGRIGAIAEEVLRWPRLRFPAAARPPARMNRSVIELGVADAKMRDMVEAAMVESWGVVRAHLDHIDQVLIALVREGVETGEFEADPEVAGPCIRTAMVRFSHPALIAQCADMTRPTLDQAIEFVMAALSPRAGIAGG
jgi:AcrR family transcriptional regulator